MIFKDITISCDLCNAEVRSSTSALEARQKAKGKGWKRRKHDGKLIDVCPTCAESEKE